ncbi:protein transport inhibitor response 1, partial [Phtheirospermum japonicum]
ELDLKKTEDLSGHWLSHFPDKCTSLVSFNISCLDLEVSFSALECLVARCPNLRTLRLNRDIPLQKLPTLLHPEIRPDIFSNLTEVFSACKQLKDLSGFWDVVPDYLPAMYSACSGITL